MHREQTRNKSYLFLKVYSRKKHKNFKKKKWKRFFLDTIPAIEAYLQCIYQEEYKHAYNVENDTLEKKNKILREKNTEKITFPIFSVASLQEVMFLQSEKGAYVTFFTGGVFPVLKRNQREDTETQTF